MDTLSNFITSIRNAELAGHASLETPFTRIAFEIAQILKKEGYISDVKIIEQKPQSRLSVTLLSPVVRHHYKRLSTPGRRTYVPADKIPTVLRGLGSVIISTSQGVMTGKKAKKAGIGGELLLEVY